MYTELPLNLQRLYYLNFSRTLGIDWRSEMQGKLCSHGWQTLPVCVSCRCSSLRFVMGLPLPFPTV